MSKIELVVDAIEFRLLIVFKRQVVCIKLVHFDTHGLSLFLDLLESRD